MTLPKEPRTSDPSSSETAQHETDNSRIEALEDTVRQLDKRLDTLEALVRLLNTGSPATMFHEHRSVAWKRTGEGGWVPAPYCPTCKLQLADVAHIVYQCPKCKLKAPFKPVEMKKILSELPVG